MKRLLSLVLLSFLMIACESNVDSGSPVVQAEIDGSLFRSKAQIVKDNEDNFVLRASNVDVLSISLSDVSPGIYEIGPNTDNQVTFRRDGDLFVSNGPGTGGVLEIERADSLSMWGNFNFNLRLNGSGRLLNVNKGVFFDVPFMEGEETDLPDDELPGELEIPDQSNTSDNNYLEVDINGEFFEADIALALYNNSTFNQLAIYGLKLDSNEQVIINVSVPINETGSYSFEEEMAPHFAVYDPNPGAGDNVDMFAETGFVTIETFNEDVVIGFFEFTTEAGDVLTDGDFEISELQLGNE